MPLLHHLNYATKAEDAFYNDASSNGYTGMWNEHIKGSLQTLRVYQVDTFGTVFQRRGTLNRHMSWTY